MRRLFRAAFTTIAAGSFLLCTTTVVLWVVSFRIPTSFQGSHRESVSPGEGHICFLTVAAGRGGMQVQYGVEVWAVMKPVSSTGWKWGWQHDRPQEYPRPWFRAAHPFLGFYANWMRNRATIDREAIVPCWFLAGVSAILPALWLRSDRRDRLIRRRRLAGLCLTCGYNLTGNLSGRCPECGTAHRGADEDL